MKKETIWCKIGCHNWEFVDVETSEKVWFADSPAARLKEKCVNCGKIRYTRVNLSMPEKEVYNNRIWD